MPRFTPPSGPNIGLTLAISLLLALHPFNSLQAQEVLVQRLSSAETRVEVVSRVLSEAGESVVETNGYVQIATGQNYWDERRQSWEPTVEEVVLAKSGAAALRGPQKVLFSPTLDDPRGTLDVLNPDGQRLRSAVLALCYFDPVSGQRITFGLVRDVPGELLPPNQVIYRDAFSAADDPAISLAVDVVYTYRQSGTEQDVVFREAPPVPESFGLSSLVARLEVLTEFYEAPSPQKIVHLLATVEDPILRARVAVPDWVDEHLDFGSLILGEGRAFQPGKGPFMRPGGEGGVLVAKQWLEEGPRRVLSESVEYTDVGPMLLELGPDVEAAHLKADSTTKWAAMGGLESWKDRLKLAVSGASARRGQEARLPDRQRSTAQINASPLQMAMAPRGAGLPSKAVIIDYLPLVTDLTNYTFRGDETYYVTNIVNLRGTTTIEGGTVIKYAPYAGGGPVPQLTVLGPLTCATSAYRPAVFTSQDDQSVGQRIAGSFDTPSAGVFYGIHALWFQTDPSSVLLEHVRFRYSGHAVLFTQRSGTVRHAQFQYCQYPVYGDRASGLKVHNMLASALVSDGAPFKPYNTTTMTGEHVTVCNARDLRYADATATLTLRNTILAAVTNIQAYGGRNDPLYGNAESTSPTGLFQSVGAGAFYLATASTNRNAGVTSIDSQLALQLRSLTTFPPEVRTSDFTSNTTLGPSANVARDADTPDRGYHYVPLDYCLSALSLTNATLTLTNGVALGMYGPKGLVLRENARLTSDGSPTLLNRVVRFNTVQEGTNNWGNAPTNSFIMLEVNSTGSPAPSVRLNFTEVSHLAITTNSTTARRFTSASSSMALDPLALSHCQIRGVHIEIGYAASVNNSYVALTNNLFEGSIVSFVEIAGNNLFNLLAYNNLFYRGKVTFDNQDSTYSWTIRDNLFDCDTLTTSGYLTASHSGFRSGLTSFGSNNKTGLVPDYQVGPLGRYYYPVSGGATSLASLINTGSRNATNATLWHYTTTTDLRRETNSVVDIGFHYLATDSGGNPLDMDADGFADFSLDPTGRGLGDSDYDGITDAEEVAAGRDSADPLSTVSRRLAYWRFNGATLLNEAGYAPIQADAVSRAPSWSGTAVHGTNSNQFLRYNSVEADGTANLNLRNGTVRMWFRPDWTSQTLGGGGIGNHAALLQVGPNVDGLTWVLSLWNHGNELNLVTRQRLSNGQIVRLDALRQPIAWTNGSWYQLVLTYTPTNVAFYINGELASHKFSYDARPAIEGTNLLMNVGEGIRFFPDLITRNDGLRIGHRYNTNAPSTALPCKGQIDELETFNYPLSPAEIARGFQTLPGDTVPPPALDTDYDGRSDFAESQVDRSATNNAADVLPVRLGSWRFTDAGFTGDQGQVPLSTANLITTPSWSGNAADLSTSRVAYRDAETNGLPNFNCANGGLRFWFKPSWNSGSGPSGAPLIWMGDTVNPVQGSWTLRIDSSGSALRLVTSSNNVTVTNLSATLNLVANTWYLMALNHTPTNSVLYTNGVQAGTAGSGITRWPSATARAVGLHLGNDPTWTRPANGALDELEIWNAPLTTSDTTASFQSLKTLDADLNGRLDVTEEMDLSGAHRPFLGEAFAVTGAFEAEQYDQGTNGAAYSSANAPQSVYRPGRLGITVTTDSLPNGAGGSDALSGYDLHLKAGEWAKYTLDVRVAGTYAIEARVAGYGTGGTFRMDVSRTGATNYATTGTLTIPGTAWSTVGTRLISLQAGANTLQLSGVVNASGQSYAGRFNYLVIYPSWNEGLTNIGANEVTLTTLTANDDSWSVATNNAGKLQAAISNLVTSPSQGGRINLQGGVFYLAQERPNELTEAHSNAAVFLPKSYIEIKGAGRTNTQLVAHNRATTLLYLGRPDKDSLAAVTNVVLRDLTIAGRPHKIAVSNGAGGYTTTNEVGWLAVAEGSTTGSLVVCDGDELSGRPTTSILVTNCQFRNPHNVAWRMSGGYKWVSNIAFRASEFFDRVPTNGMITNATAPSSGLLNTTNRPSWTSAHIMGAVNSAKNVLLVGNVFNGNVGITSGPDPTPYNGGDGILWLQSAGNWYAADNMITNYYLEGIQLNGGPAAVVRNRFVTRFNNGSTTGLNTVGQYPGASSAFRQDLVFSVLANSFIGGRNANLGAFSGLEYINTGYRLDLSGNRASMYPLAAAETPLPGTFCGTHTNLFLNLSGNTVQTNGSAMSIGYCGGVAYLLNNDFGGTQFRGLLDDGPSSLWQSVAVAGNTINRGSGDHLRTRPATAPKWFLRGNTYKSGSTNVSLQMSHPSLPVHLVQ